MVLSAEKSVGEIAAGIPGAARVFEKHHIDYCCGGKHPLADACRVAGLVVGEVLEEVEQASRTADPQGEPDWNLAPLQSLVQHLVDTHHTWVYLELPQIDQLIRAAAGRHGAGRPELLAVQRIFSRLREELEGHIRKEETVLFPAIVRVEAMAASGGSLPREPFGSLRHPVAMLEDDHEKVAQFLDEMRDLTYGYDLPQDACMSLRRLYERLEEFEHATHRHVHLESNVLFPRAARLEREGRVRASAKSASLASQ
jgi:regulator of cell morphogenesis and NO signaling